MARTHTFVARVLDDMGGARAGGQRVMGASQQIAKWLGRVWAVSLHHCVDASSHSSNRTAVAVQHQLACHQYARLQPHCVAITGIQQHQR